MYDLVTFDNISFRQHRINCPDCGYALKLRPKRKKTWLEDTKVFYGCSNYPVCDSVFPANIQGDLVGELAKRPLREARKEAWVLFQEVVAAFGAKPAYTRLKERFGTKRTSELNLQQCEELIHAIHSSRAS